MSFRRVDIGHCGSHRARLRHVRAAEPGERLLRQGAERLLPQREEISPPEQDGRAKGPEKEGMRIRGYFLVNEVQGTLFNLRDNAQSKETMIATYESIFLN